MASEQRELVASEQQPVASEQRAGGLSRESWWSEPRELMASEQRKLVAANWDEKSE